MGVFHRCLRSTCRSRRACRWRAAWAAACRAAAAAGRSTPSPRCTAPRPSRGRRPTSTWTSSTTCLPATPAASPRRSCSTRSTTPSSTIYCERHTSAGPPAPVPVEEAIWSRGYPIPYYLTLCRPRRVRLSEGGITPRFDFGPFDTCLKISRIRRSSSRPTLMVKFECGSRGWVASLQ